MVAAYGIEAGLVSPAGIPVAPAFAHAVAPAPISYARVAPYNIPPFAASVSTFAKSLALPAPLAPAGLISPYAAQFVPGPFPAPGIVPAPVVAPAFNAAIGPAFNPVVGPAAAPAFNAAFAPAITPAVAPAVAPIPSAYAPAFAPDYPRALFPSPYAAAPGAPLGAPLPLGAQFPFPLGRSVHAVAPVAPAAFAPVPAPLPGITSFGALPAAYPGAFPAPLL